MKISLPDLQVLRKCKAEISTAITETHTALEQPAPAPSPALTPWRGSTLRCTDPGPRQRVKPHVP